MEEGGYAMAMTMLNSSRVKRPSVMLRGSGVCLGAPGFTVGLGGDKGVRRKSGGGH